jgi:hypothetical protein
MKLALMLLSLTLGSVAAVKTVDLMNRSTQVMETFTQR